MKIAVVGAGIVGSTLAILLTREGHTVTLYERRTTDDEGVALTLHKQGIEILASIGVNLDPHWTSGVTVQDLSGNRLALIDQSALDPIVTIRFSTILQKIRSNLPSPIRFYGGTTVRAITSSATHMSVHTAKRNHSFDGVIVAAGQNGRTLASYAPVSKRIGYSVARAIVPRDPKPSYGEKWGPGIRAGRLPIDESWDYTWLTISERRRSKHLALPYTGVDHNSLQNFHSVYSTKPPTRKEIATNTVPVVGDAFMTTSPEGGLGVTRGLIDAHRISLRLRDVKSIDTFVEATRQHALCARKPHARSLFLTNLLAGSHSFDTALFGAIRSRVLQTIGDRGFEVAWRHLTRSIGTL